MDLRAGMRISLLALKQHPGCEWEEAGEQLSFNHAGVSHISHILSGLNVPLLSIRIPSQALFNAENYMLKAGSEGHFINPTTSDI